MKKRLKSNKGITLIALVVTIVVLIILASVSIATLTGDNGIIGQSKEAKEQTEIAEEKEIVNIATADAMEKDRFGKVTRENLQEALDELAGKGRTTVTGETNLTVLFKDSNREYYVNTDGKLIDSVDYTNIYTYTEEGYITGIKEEYIKIDTSSLEKRYATTGDVKLSAAPSTYYLVDELNGTLKIPNKINDTNIIGIAPDAFSYIENLKQVTIENGIEMLGDDCFQYCHYLSKIKLPDSLVYIGDGLFAFTALSQIIIPSNVQLIAQEAFDFSALTVIIIQKEEGSLEGEPWGAPQAMIIYTDTNNEEITEFTNNYLADKNEQELEEIILKDERYIGTFEEYLSEQGKSRDDLNKEASNNNMSYTEYLKSIIKKNGWWIITEYKCSLLGILDKSVEELEKIFVETIGETGTFDEFLENERMTRQEFEEMYKSQGYRTEIDFLKINIIIYM